MRLNIFEGADEDRPAFAAILILAALTALSFQDGLVKFAAPYTSIWQFQIMRATFNLSWIVVVLALNYRLALLWPRNPGAVALRTIVMVTTMYFFFAGAPFLTLAEMGAGLYTYPVFNTILSLVFLKERVGPWRVAAITLSAIGALMIIRPGSTEFSLTNMLPVCAGFFYAVNSTILRLHCRSESPLTLTGWLGFGFLIFCSISAVTVAALPMAEETRAAWPFLLRPWPAISLFVLGLAAIASLCNVIGNVLIVKGYQSGELSWLAPFDYSYLIFAALWGYILFADRLEPGEILGMALIAAGGILTALRENRIRSTNPVVRSS